MVQVRVATLAVDSASRPVVLLKPFEEPAGEGTLLPIWIGLAEATAILVALDATETPPRPLVYDLILRLLQAGDTRVERVDVTKIEEGTFFAEITLQTPGGTRLIDARPSDSIALAMRVGAPIFVADEVLAQAGIADTIEHAPDEKDQLQAFHDFLDQVDPEDFRG